MTNFEVFVSVFTIALVLYAMWRVGQLNPVGTGRLAQRLTVLEGRVRDAEAARAAAFGEVDLRMDAIEKSVAALADAGQATHRSVEAMRIELAADRGVTERTWESVNRIQLFFMDEGLKRMSG